MLITTAQLETFRSKLDAVNKASHKEIEQKIAGYYGGISYSVGRKYAKFNLKSGPSTTLLLFVDMLTGAILKAAGANAPAKGVRGHIESAIPEAGTFWLYR